MKNKKTYIVNIDFENKEILDGNFEGIIEGFIQYGVEFQLQLIDKSNIIDLHINTIVNEYVKHCKMTDNKRPIVVNIRLLKEFIVNLLDLTSKTPQREQEDKYDIDIIAPDGRTFRAYIPKQYLEKRYEELLGLGPDWIEGGLDTRVIFDYVLPNFYMFLFHNDLFDNEKFINLSKYKFGLA